MVSVLMTAYNREKYIAEAIESVIASTYQDWELIIVDDCSKDRTVEIAKTYEATDRRIKVYTNEVNLGDYPNRNKAASYAKGKYIKYLDSDDLIYPYALAVFVECMEKYPDAVLGITSRNAVPLYPFPIRHTPEAAYKKHFFIEGLLDFGPSGTILLRETFETLGKFSGKRYVGDMECWLKMAALHPIVELPPSLIYWRRHEGQEYQIGNTDINEGYFSMNFLVINSAISEPNCPLSPEEKTKLLNSQRKTYARSVIKYILKTGKVRTGIQKFSQLGLSIKDLFNP